MVNIVTVKIIIILITITVNTVTRISCCILAVGWLCDGVFKGDVKWIFCSQHKVYISRY